MLKINIQDKLRTCLRTILSKVLSFPAHTKKLIIRDQNYQTCLIFGLHATNDQNRQKDRPHTRATGLSQWSRMTFC